MRSLDDKGGLQQSERWASLVSPASAGVDERHARPAALQRDIFPTTCQRFSLPSAYQDEGVSNREDAGIRSARRHSCQRVDAGKVRGNGEGGRRINYRGVSFTTGNSSRQLARTSGDLGSKYTHRRADLRTGWRAHTHRCTQQIVGRRWETSRASSLQTRFTLVQVIRFLR